MTKILKARKNKKSMNSANRRRMKLADLQKAQDLRIVLSNALELQSNKSVNIVGEYWLLLLLIRSFSFWWRKVWMDCRQPMAYEKMDLNQIRMMKRMRMLLLHSMMVMFKLQKYELSSGIREH